MLSELLFHHYSVFSVGKFIKCSLSSGIGLNAKAFHFFLKSFGRDGKRVLWLVAASVLYVAPPLPEGGHEAVGGCGRRA